VRGNAPSRMADGSQQDEVAASGAPRAGASVDAATSCLLADGCSISVFGSALHWPTCLLRCRAKVNNRIFECGGGSRVDDRTNPITWRVHNHEQPSVGGLRDGRERAGRADWKRAFDPMVRALEI
jgi:hypothetical protein